MRRGIKKTKNSRRNWFTYSAAANLIIVLGLFTTSCTPSSSMNGQHTQTPEPLKTLIVTQTPAITLTPEISPSEAARIPSTEIDALMGKLVDQTPLAGIAIGVHFKDEFYERGYGLAELSSREPVTTQTVFKIASLTKAMTAAAILRLGDEGKLSLDDPISRFIPGTPDVAKNILVRHLLNHTSGLPDWSIDTAQETLPENFTAAQAVEYYFSSMQKLDFEPGKVWAYTNIGYFLLGAIVEDVSGMPYQEYLRTTFFEPLELPSFSACDSQIETLAVGYHSVNKQFEVAHPSNLKLLGAAGGLCSNIADLLKWQVALTHAKVITPELWNRMSTPDTLSDGSPLDYGFGVSVKTGEHGQAIMHDGATAGFNSFFVYFPEHDLNIVLLTNTDGFDSHLRAFAFLVASKLLRA
jgi:D-alanyl-D-alanine carboxypeptidase